MMDLREVAFVKRKSIKRAIARFCYLKQILLSEDEFMTLVRRTQESGYVSAIKYLSQYLENQLIDSYKKKKLLLEFTIEYNTEMHLKQFPKSNQSVERILTGNRTAEDMKFFKETLFDIVKANKLQLKIISEYV